MQIAAPLLAEKEFSTSRASFATFKEVAKLIIKTVKDTLPGFLSHYLPSRISDKYAFIDRLGCCNANCSTPL